MAGTVRVGAAVGVGCGVAAAAGVAAGDRASKVASTAITTSSTTTPASPAASRRRDPRVPGVRGPAPSTPAGPRSITSRYDTTVKKRISAGQGKRKSGRRATLEAVRAPTGPGPRDDRKEFTHDGSGRQRHPGPQAGRFHRARAHGLGYGPQACGGRLRRHGLAEQDGCPRRRAGRRRRDPRGLPEDAVAAGHLFSMLANEDVVRAVLPPELLSAAPPGFSHVNHATISARRPASSPRTPRRPGTATSPPL